MRNDWLSVEDVAERLDLHVRTIRSYVRDGRLPAVRIGKQYRIAQADLDALLARPAAVPTSGPTPRRAEVSAVVELDDVDRRTADRLSTLVIAGAGHGSDAGPALRLRTVYDEDRGHLKIIVLGDVGDAAAMLQAVDDLVGSTVEES